LIGLILLASYFGGRAAHYFKSPRVTGYLVTGVILSPSVLGILQEEVMSEKLGLITDIALAIIAFSIGGSLELEKLRKIGKQIFWITLSESMGAFLITTGLLGLFFYFLHDWIAIPAAGLSTFAAIALMLGSISAATAPAATLAILHEYGGKGAFTSILLGVVGLDDGMAIILSAFSITIVRSVLTVESLNWLMFFVSICQSILIALVLGAAAGWLLRFLMGSVIRRESMLSVMIGTILLISGLASNLDASPLLANMMLGFMVVNHVARHNELFTMVESMEDPIFGMFFVLAGARLNLDVLRTSGLLAVILILVRFAGKLLGAYLGARISQAPSNVRKYLGYCLLPQAGVAIGLILEATAVMESSHLSTIMLNAVLGSVAINELLTPLFVRFSIIQAGDVNHKAVISENR
jgi:Kef-type K+ transport system membrane component KefB